IGEIGDDGERAGVGGNNAQRQDQHDREYQALQPFEIHALPPRNIRNLGRPHRSSRCTFHRRPLTSFTRLALTTRISKMFLNRRRVKPPGGTFPSVKTSATTRHKRGGGG